MLRYFDYIAALASKLVSNFGLDAVRSWKWGVFTEFNNQQWLVGGQEVFFEISSSFYLYIKLESGREGRREGEGGEGRREGEGREGEAILLVCYFIFILSS
jgi:hypothetical protein